MILAFRFVVDELKQFFFATCLPLSLRRPKAGSGLGESDDFRPNGR
jgi:hypothetical protein